MEVLKSDTPFRIFTYRSKKRTVRFLVGPSVMERIPFLEEIRMQAAAGVSFYEYIWHASVVITGAEEWERIPSDSLEMRLPDWLFEKVGEARQKPRRWRDLLIGRSEICGPAWEIAWTMSHYLRHLQDQSRPQEHDAMFLKMAIEAPFEYRPVRTWTRSVLILPFILVGFSVVLVASFIFPRNTRLLRFRAKVQKAFERRFGLAKTRQRLLDLGEPPENLKEFVLPPNLKPVEDKVDNGNVE